MLRFPSMPTPVAHALAGTAVYFASRRREDLWLFPAVVVSACFADLDFGLNFLTGENYHHYFTHSLGFASLFSLGTYVAARLAKRPEPGRDTLLVAIAYLTHMGLDLFSRDTSRPYGMELLWPFSERFVIAPLPLFDDIHRGTLAKLLSLHNWLAVGREILIVGPVAFLAWRFGRHSE